MSERLLKAKEISCRINTVTEKGITLLLYVTSRAGMNLLDQKYGELNWKRQYRTIDGQLFCSVSVWNPEIGEWVQKEDVGTESCTEKEKGRASDAFKRACVNFGIARELYSAPTIFIDAGHCNIRKIEKDGRTKYTCYDKFSVKVISYNKRREIDSLEIINSNLETVYKQWPVEKIDNIKLKTIRDALKQSGVDERKVLDMCSIDSLEEMEVKDYKPVYNRLLGEINRKAGTTKITEDMVKDAPFA